MKNQYLNFFSSFFFHFYLKNETKNKNNCFVLFDAVHFCFAFLNFFFLKNSYFGITFLKRIFKFVFLVLVLICFCFFFKKEKKEKNCHFFFLFVSLLFFCLSFKHLNYSVINFSISMFNLLGFVFLLLDCWEHHWTFFFFSFFVFWKKINFFFVFLCSFNAC